MPSITRHLDHRFIPARAGEHRVAALAPALAFRRFIPARAGNTRHTPSVGHRRLSSSVHPRPRGEHSLTRSTVLAPKPLGGSSPPARGTPANAKRLGVSTTGSSPPARGTLFPQDIDSKGVAAHQRPHQLRSPDPGEEAMARSRRVAPRFQLVPRWAVAARIARA